MKCNSRASELKTRKGLGSKVDHGEQVHIPHSKLKAGDITHRIPIHPDEKTTVYCSPDSNLEEREKFWHERLNQLT